MEVNRQLLDKIAHLARLELDEDKVEKMMQDMTNILTWVERLSALNTDGVEPLTTMSHEVNAFREDRVGVHLSHEEILKNAPDKDAGYFRVPKVID